MEILNRNLLISLFLIIQSQAYLEDIVGLVPDHCNKVNITIKHVVGIYCFPSAYKSYVYTIL